MSFPYHDPYWCTVADFIDVHRRTADRILANDIFWWRFDELFRYGNLHLNPDAEYDWVVVHKGELTSFPLEFLNGLPLRYTPVMANPVFIVWAASGRNLVALKEHPDFTCFGGLVEKRAGEEFVPQALDDAVLPVPGRMVKFESLNKTELASAMDRFYDRGGYEYETLRDKAFYNEIDRWLRAFWRGLETGDVLDIACGRGRVADTVGSYRSMVETDLSPVAVAATRKAGAGNSRRRAMVMDAEQIEFSDESFDAVTFIEGAEHVHDFAKVIREIFRVLRKNGVLIMNAANADSMHQRLTRKLGYPYFKTNYQHIREYSWAETHNILEEAGFTVEQAEGIFLYPYWGIPGVDEPVRAIMDNDAEFVEIMRSLGEKAGPNLAYCTIIRARKA